MGKASILKKVLILAAILALPGFLYYLLTVGGKNRYKPLPFYGPKQVARTFHKVRGKQIPDTIYHKLPEFALTDQNGKPVTSGTLKDNIFVVNFFYTNSTGVSKTVNNNLKALLSEFKKSELVRFISITVDPERDQLPVLKKYSETYNAPKIKWLFARGDTASVYALARNGFLVNALDAGSGNFIHSDKLILIDKEKRIRGYYSGVADKEITRLDDEIKVLIAEELRKVDKALY